MLTNESEHMNMFLFYYLSLINFSFLEFLNSVTDLILKFLWFCVLFKEINVVINTSVFF